MCYIKLLLSGFECSLNTRMPRRIIHNKINLRYFVWASVSSYSLFCNCLFVNLFTYLDDQLRWAFAFLV